MRSWGVRLLLLGVLLPGGCGYSFGYQAREELRTLEVPVFDNESFRRRHEMTLTELTIEEIRRLSPYRVVASGGEAQLVGRILAIEETVLVEDELDRVIEGAISITVQFWVVDSATGEMLVEPVSISDRAEISQAAGNDEESAIRETLGELARRIVGYLEAW